MKAELKGTTERIRNPHEAKRWVQNHARICYTEKDWDQLIEEGFKEGLVGSLLCRGHHSPFDHFFLNFYLDGNEKALAMIFNNQGMYTTSEKSARYTVMSGAPEKQRQLYEKWDKWFLGHIASQFPETRFPKIYQKGADGKTGVEKLAQENARYMTSVFTPTKMTHSVTWRQMNILYHWFNDFIEQNADSSDEYKARLANSMRGFVEADDVKRMVIEEAQVKMKGNIPLRFFRDRPVEEHFGEDIYSTNYQASFASLAQLHRHRLAVCDVSDGWQKGASMSFYVPRLVEAFGRQNEWLDDLSTVSQTDFPQAQLLTVGERGMREHLPAKTEERLCGLAQLETARVVGKVLEKYAAYVPEMAQANQPICLREGCKKGGCTFGPNLYLERLI